MSDVVTDLEALEAIYGAPVPGSLKRATPKLTPH